MSFLLKDLFIVLKKESIMFRTQNGVQNSKLIFSDQSDTHIYIKYSGVTQQCIPQDGQLLRQEQKSVSFVQPHEIT